MDWSDKMTRFKHDDYYVSIGLEIHIALNTKEKLFSRTVNQFSNTHFDPFDYGLSGVLPILNRNFDAVKQAVLFGLATNANINLNSSFDRKHYFYPDLAIGYQITQQYNPILKGGRVSFLLDNQELKTVEIEHAHLECDAAKLVHTSDSSLVDLSRGSSPLLEVVSMPVIHSPIEAREYARTVFNLANFWGIVDGKIEEGSFRMDASISLNKDPNKLGTRVEIKNLSSFRYLEAALNYEIERQAELLDAGQAVLMQTRLYDEDKQATFAMRDKETENDYRYLPDPDIPTLSIVANDVEKLQKENRLFDYSNALHKWMMFGKLKVGEADMVIRAYHKQPSSEIFLHVPDMVEQRTSTIVKLFAHWLPDYLNNYDNRILILPDVQEWLALLNERDIDQSDFQHIMKALMNNVDYQKLTELIPQSSLSNDELVQINTWINEALSNQKPDMLAKLIGNGKIVNVVMGAVMKHIKTTNINVKPKELSDMIGVALQKYQS